MLGDLFATPGVRIFQGVCPGADIPPVPHVISAGLHLVFVESVAWPPGRYTISAVGQVHCGGVYIGQSVRVLAEAVRRWRADLPHGHRVSAVVVVHGTLGRELALPTSTGLDVSWTSACDAVAAIRAQIGHRIEPASLAAVAALVAATVGEVGAG